MAHLLQKDIQLAKDGKRQVCIRGLTDLASYPRQRLKKKNPNGQTETIVPLNDFLEKIRPGIGAVSKNALRETIDTVTQHSYRKTETIMDKKFTRETIRREVLKKGEQAKTLSLSSKEERVIPEAKLKDAGDKTQTYKTSKGSSMRQCIGKLLDLERIYLLVDGVQVFQKDKGAKGEESRECKVGAMLRQNKGKISEIAAWCAWGRIKSFRSLTAAALMALVPLLKSEIIIISDGAKWIRNIRKWIPTLKNASWILDWFHLKDHLLKCLRLLGIETGSETARTLISLLWMGNADETARMIRELPRSTDTKKRKTEDIAVKGFITYLENQQEGIINYEEYKRQGYIVGSGYIEKLNDTLIKRRMVDQKRMRWSLTGGAAMMALLAAKHNGRLAEVFT